MTGPRITILSGGLGSPSQTGLLAQAFTAAISRQQPAAHVQTVPVKELGADMLAALGAFTPERLRAVFAQVKSADAVVVLTPILNAAPAGLIKLFLDVLPEGTLRGTPVLLGATGGTPRHSLALDYSLRPVLTYLHADVLATTVFVATSDWGGADDVRPVEERIAQAVGELLGKLAGDPPAAQPDSVAADLQGLDLEDAGELESITQRLQRLSPPPGTPLSTGRDGQ